MKSLAEQVGLSSPAMIERVRRLEERGVIAGYRAIVGAGRAGSTDQRVDRGHGRPAASGCVQPSGAKQAAVAEVHRTTGDATHLVKVHVPDMATLEKIVDDLSETGARCQTTIVLSSPVPYRPVTAPEGTVGAAVATHPPPPQAVAEDGSLGETTKRPGRPRGRRPAAA